MSLRRVPKVVVQDTTTDTGVNEQRLGGRKFAGWEGGLAPAEVPHPVNTELTVQAEKTFSNL